MKNNKGFSLVELLATIVIIGIVSGIGIVSYNAIRANINKDFYENQKETISLAAQTYLQSNTSKRPGSVGATKEITLKELIDNNFIEPVKDPHDEVCNANKTIISVTRKNENDLIFKVNLVCNSYQDK